MDQSILISEFLDELGQRADRSFAGHMHKAFVDWYVEAEFGPRIRWEFTDDASDGGIDAIIWLPNENPGVTIIQSKFTEKVGRNLLAQSAYKDFLRVTRSFYHGEEAFHEFIATVRDDLRHIYRRAHAKLSDAQNWLRQKKAFRLITTCVSRRKSEFDLIPSRNFIYSEEILSLYEKYRRGATPTAPPLLLSVDDKLCYRDSKTGMKSYLFNARVSDLRKYLEHIDVARLVARNIRFNLGGAVGKAIRSTYESKPHDFWYLHNGLTVLCNELEERNQVATLTNPSVVNGAQTLYAISGSANRSSSALVTMRAIVIGENNGRSMDDNEWVQGIIRGVNTQNKVKQHDFRSNEPEQIELQSRFRDVKVFYERKRGEWKENRNDSRFKDFARLTLVELGRVLTAGSDDIGQGVLLLKRGLEEVFKDKHYKKIFPSKSKVGRRFERIYFAYRCYCFLWDTGYRTSKERRKRQHAFWNSFWIFQMGLSSLSRFHSRTSLAQIRNAFDDFERHTKIGASARKQAKQVTLRVWQAWRIGRRKDPELYTPNNFFKTTYGNRKVLLYAYPKLRPGLQRLSRQIMEY